MTLAIFFYSPPPFWNCGRRRRGGLYSIDSRPERRCAQIEELPPVRATWRAGVLVYVQSPAEWVDNNHPLWRTDRQVWQGKFYPTSTGLKTVSLEEKGFPPFPWYPIFTHWALFLFLSLPPFIIYLLLFHFFVPFYLRLLSLFFHILSAFSYFFSPNWLRPIFPLVWRGGGIYFY